MHMTSFPVAVSRQCLSTDGIATAVRGMSVSGFAMFSPVSLLSCTCE